MIGYLLTHYVSPKARRTVGFVLLDLSVVGMFLSVWGVVAKNEPIWVLVLSWLALTLTAWDIVSTTDVRHQQPD